MHRSAYLVCSLLLPAVVVSGCASAPPARDLSGQDPAGRFTFVYPSTWSVVRGTGDVVLTVRSPEAAASVTLSLEAMRVPLVHDWDDTFRVIEEDKVRSRRPHVEDLRSSITDSGPLPRQVLAEYAHPPGSDGSARVLVKQYSLPIPETTDLYHLSWSIQEPAIPQHQRTLERIVASFTLRAPR
jgi:hypothetical protein